MNLKKNSLGRGLGALIEDNVSETRTVVGSVNEIEIRNNTMFPELKITLTESNVHASGLILYPILL